VSIRAPTLAPGAKLGSQSTRTSGVHKHCVSPCDTPDGVHNSDSPARNRPSPWPTFLHRKPGLIIFSRVPLWAATLDSDTTLWSHSTRNSEIHTHGICPCDILSGNPRIAPQHCSARRWRSTKGARVPSSHRTIAWRLRIASPRNPCSARYIGTKGVGITSHSKPQALQVSHHGHCNRHSGATQKVMQTEQEQPRAARKHARKQPASKPVSSHKQAQKQPTSKPKSSPQAAHQKQFIHKQP
jgi:hypothetical protein